MASLTIIIPAAIFGAILGAVIKGLFDIYSKNKEYKHSYYQMIVEKRVKTCEDINTVVAMLKASVLDGGKAYHMIFSGDRENFMQEYKVLRSVFLNDIWMSDRIKNSLLCLHGELVRCLILHDRGEELTSIGKQEYETIGKLRDELEKGLLIDLQDLYKIGEFLSNKEVITKYYHKDISQRPKI